MRQNAMVAVMIVLGALSVSPISAQTSGPPQASASGTPRTAQLAAPQTFGTATPTSYVVGAYDFDPADSAATTVMGTATGQRFFTSAGALVAPVHLPNGALIVQIELEGCDTSAGGQMTATLLSSTTIGGVQSQASHGSVATDAATSTPGCDFFGAGLTPMPVVDNFNRTYYVEVIAGSANNTNRFSAVRVFYFLQVSPAPATATFADVPLQNPFNRFVEALLAAGITGGCGGGNYCPDLPVTRGQMAVFIATALGLHFPL